MIEGAFSIEGASERMPFHTEVSESLDVSLDLEQNDVIGDAIDDVMERLATTSYDVIAEQARRSCGVIPDSAMMSDDVIAKYADRPIERCVIGTRPSIVRNRANSTGARGLVRPSASMEVVAMYSIDMMSRSTSFLN